MSINTVSIDNAKKLKSLGLRQECFFVYCATNPSTQKLVRMRRTEQLTFHKNNETYAAFTVDELVAILFNGHAISLKLAVDDVGLVVCKVSIKLTEYDVQNFKSDTSFADALATAIITLVENKSISIYTLNHKIAFALQHDNAK